MGEMLNKKIALILLLCLAGTTGFSICSYSERNLLLSQLEDEGESRQYWQSQYELLNGSYSSLSNGYSSLQKEKEGLEEQLKNATAEKESLKKENEALNQSYAFLLGNYTSLESNYTSLSADYSSLQRNYTEAVGEINDLNQRISQLEGRLNFVNFNNLTELEQWLDQDNTSEHQYIEDQYDCDDFACDLMTSAFKSGYKIGTAAVYYTDNLTYVNIFGQYYYNVPLAYTVGNLYKYHIFGNHMVNIAYVGDTGWVLIEPQTDEVFPLNTYEL